MTLVRKKRKVVKVHPFEWVNRILWFGCFFSLVWSLNTFVQNQNSKKTISSISTSWSDDSFNGKKTSSGVAFNSNSFTAAHKTLDFGQIVIITNELDGEVDKSVIVKINDRLPPDSPSDLVVTAAVAEELGIIGKPITNLKLTIIKY